MNARGIIIALVGVLAAGVVGYLCGRECPRNPQESTPTSRVDTLVIRDTIRAKEPIFYNRIVVDSILVPVHDTTMVHDTLLVVLAREQVTWEDSLARVYASGIYPQVDSVIHYTREKVIVKEIPVTEIRKTRWGIGVQAGMGAGRDGLTPYVGVGVSYNILAW